MNLSFSDWQSPNSVNESSSLPVFGAQPMFRNNKDYQLAGYRTMQDTTYPDGYLGTMSSNRRQDKTLGTLSRKNARQYSRGVHKGERVNPGDYVWPEEFNLWTGVAYQDAGVKFAPPGAMPVVLTNDGKVGPRGIPRTLYADNQEYIDLERRAGLKSLQPSWR